MILGMNEWTNDTKTKKENEPAKKWLSWVANWVAAPIMWQYGAELSAQ